MLRKRLNKDLLIFDGGFGSQLQELGMKAGEIPEYYNIEHPETIIEKRGLILLLQIHLAQIPLN